MTRHRAYRRCFLPLISSSSTQHTLSSSPYFCAVQMAEVVNSGALLPDGLILDVLHSRLHSGRAAGEKGVLLDGFPRTRAQVWTA